MITKKEKQVLELRKKGLKQYQIGSRLKISQPAVSSFVNNALKKIRNAKKIVDYAKELGIEIDEE